MNNSEETWELYRANALAIDELRTALRTLENAQHRATEVLKRLEALAERTMKLHHAQSLGEPPFATEGER